MRVLVAGATGHIGSAVVRELLQARHQVVGLARSDTAAAALSGAGVDVHRGDLDDLDSLRAGAVAADGVIFTANKHISETTDSAARAKVELNAVEAIGSELEGTSKPFAVTSTLIGIARTTGVSAFVGDGSNRWPSVHRRDAATLYRLAVESAPAGARLHAVAEEGVPFRDIAQAISRQLKLPAVSMTAEEAGRHFGFLAPFVSIDNPTSNALTRERLGWKPDAPALIPDLEEGHYFND